MIKTELCIIGGGAAGLSLAAGAAQLGINVLLVEADKMGGDCLNYGCVPSKSLLAIAKQYYNALKQEKLGVQITQSSLDFQKVREHIQLAIATIEPHDSVERFESLGCQVIIGTARFIDDKTLAVNDTEIKASKFIIATGSKPFIPKIKGLDQINYHTNENIFDLECLPKHLMIIGGGPIACELGQAFAMLGSQVSIIARNGLLKRDEEDCVEIIRQSMLSMNIKLYEHTEIKSTAELNDRKVIVIEHNNEQQILTGSTLLIATGRLAATKKLLLENAKVNCDAKGIIKVNTSLQTSNPSIYAMGDVIGETPFTHMASYHASLLIKHLLFRMRSKLQYDYMPWVTYTEPQLAHVGLTTKQAKSKGIPIVTTELNYSEIDRAICEGDLNGKIKVISDKKGKVLGVSIVGAQSGELISLWVMAVKEKMTLRKITDLIIPYPTLSELNKRVASKFYQEKLFSNKVRKLVQWIKRC